MSYPLKVIILNIVEIFIEKLSPEKEVELDASITAIRYGNFNTVYIKTLKGGIKELIIKRSRFIFFIKNETIYFVSAFMKKTNKTPKQEIKNAEKIYKLISS